MSSQTLGIIIGGFIPAFLYGMSIIFTKASQQAEIGIGPYLVILSMSIFLVGLLLYFLPVGGNALSLKSGTHAFLAGLSWAFGAAGVMTALTLYAVPVGNLVPLFNMNTLVAVLLALWIFAEWKQVRVPQLLIGSILIIIGGTLVARA